MKAEQLTPTVANVFFPWMGTKALVCFGTSTSAHMSARRRTREVDLER